MATCATCGAEIVWATNDRTGKPAPIDATPDPAGNVIFVTDDVYRVLTKTERASYPNALLIPVSSSVSQRYTNHWQTCANPPEKTR
jgi:hypothetical protein